MKLQVKHSNKYLAKNANNVAIQNKEGDEWLFISENNKEIEPTSGQYGRIVLKHDYEKFILEKSEERLKCLQPSNIFPHDGWLIDLSPIQIDNNSQLWLFTLKDEDGFFVIQNKNERREDGKNISITKSCMDVCGVRIDDGIFVITYHVSSRTGSNNQRWRII